MSTGWLPTSRHNKSAACCERIINEIEVWQMAIFAMDWAPMRVRDFCKAAEQFLEAGGPSQVHMLQNDFKELFGDMGLLQELVNITCSACSKVSQMKAIPLSATIT
jgi:hypothetical protein